MTKVADRSATVELPGPRRTPEAGVAGSNPAGGTIPMMAGRIDSFYGQRPNLKEFAPDGIIGELQRLNYDTANATSAPAIAALLKLVPASKITYGTDYPYFGLGQMKNLEQLGLGAADLKAIGGENAIKLIPRLKV